MSKLLFCRFPLAADGRHDSALFLQLGESLVNDLAVKSSQLGNLASVQRHAGLAHHFKHLFFSFHRCKI